MKHLQRMLTEEAIWQEREKELNEYGKPSYKDGVPIRCSKEVKFQLLKDLQSERYVKHARIFTDANVKEGDKIDGKTVDVVIPIKYSGHVLLYEVITQ